MRFLKLLFLFIILGSCEKSNSDKSDLEIKRRGSAKVKIESIENDVAKLNDLRKEFKPIKLKNPIRYEYL